MRRAVVVVLGALTAMALALPAQAKIEGTTFINGPGLPGGGAGEGGGGGSIRMDGSDGGGYPVLSGMPEPGQFLTSRPPGNLGPRYVARLVITMPEGQPDVVQHLYPYANGGPVIYTPPGQEFIMSAGGWSFAPAELIRELRSRGLPETSPVATRPADGGVAAEPASGGPSPLVWGLLLLTGLLIAGALAGLRRAAVRRAA